MMRALMTDFQILFQGGENGSSTTDSGTGEPCENLGLGCEWLFEATGNERLSEIVSWVLGTPLQIVIIVIVAMFLNKWLGRKITCSPPTTRDSMTSEPVGSRGESPGSRVGQVPIYVKATESPPRVARAMTVVSG